MAFVTTLSVPVIGDGGKIKRVPVHFPSTVTLAQIQSYSDAFVAALDAMVGGVMSGPTVEFNLTLPGGLKPSPLADHFVRQGALCSFGANLTNYSHSIFAPSFRDTLIAGGDISVGDPLFTAWRDLVVTGDGTIAPTDKFGNDIDTFQSAVLSFRK